MHHNMRITARGEQDTLLIIFLVKTRVGMTTNKAAKATLNGKYQHRMDVSLVNETMWLSHSPVRVAGDDESDSE